MGLSHLKPLRKKADGRLFDARNLRFLTAKQAKIAVFSRKAKTKGESIKCIFAFDTLTLVLMGIHGFPTFIHRPT